MNTASAFVELGNYRSVCFGDFKHLKDIFRFKDLGIQDDVARARLINFNVFKGAYYGIVPILRFATAYEAGRGVCLSQVLARNGVAPEFGKTAWVSPIDGTLIENEKRLALNAFELATVVQEK